MFLFSDDLDNSELSALAENFRDQAAKLVDMLDTSIPVVARLKKSFDTLSISIPLVAMLKVGLDLLLHPYLCCPAKDGC